MRSSTALSVAALMWVAGSATGQYDWLSPVSGTWNSGGWDAPMPPAPQFPNSDTANATILAGGMPYTVSVSNGNWAVNNVSKTSSDATLQLNRALQVYGSVINQGPMAIVAPVGGGASLRFRGNGARSITGTGTIVLASNAANDQSAMIDRSAFDEATVTFGPGQTITGNGRLSVPFTNEGVITAAGGTIYINTADDMAFNNGVIEATGGGTISLADVTLDCQNLGAMTFDNSTLEFNGQTFMQRVKNATITTPNGGIVRAQQGNCEFEDVVLNGDADGATRVGYRFFGSFFENNGTVTVTGDGVNGFNAIRTGSTPYTFTGTGEMIMVHPPMTNPGTAPTIDAINAGNILTNSASHTIRGKFRVVHDMINLGTMIADQAGESVDLVNEPMNNGGVLRATGGGIIRINNDTTQTGGGWIDLDGGFLDALPLGSGFPSLTGNSVVATNGGMIRLESGNLALQNVTLETDTDVLGRILLARGGVVNNGSMLLQLNGGNFGTLEIEGNQIWSGTGEIVLNATEGDLRRARINRDAVGDTFLHVASHTIRGTGEINAAFDNHGLITADVPGRIIAIQTEDKINSGVIRADGGTIEVISVAIDQTDTGSGVGVMEAVNGGTLLFDPGIVIGGVVDAAGGIAIADGGNLDRFEDIELFGTLEIPVSNTEFVSSITNNGQIIVRSDSFGISVVELGPGFMFGGPGSVRLNGPTAPFNAVLSTTSGATETVTNGLSHEIIGSGRLDRLDLINQGTLAPGDATSAVGVFELTNNTAITCEPTSTVVIEIEGTGPGEFDSIVNVGAADTSFHCAGKLALSNSNGYPGLSAGEFIDIIVAPVGVTGTFDTVTYAGTVNYEVRYLSDRVRVAYDCRADVNNDGAVSPADFNAWIAAFNTQAPRCDQNADGLCTAADFNAWIVNFNAGC